MTQIHRHESKEVDPHRCQKARGGKSDRSRAPTKQRLMNRVFNRDLDSSAESIEDLDKASMDRRGGY